MCSELENVDQNLLFEKQKNEGSQEKSSQETVAENRECTPTSLDLCSDLDNVKQQLLLEK